MHGGILMYVILFVAVLGLGAVIERLLFLVRAERVSRGYLPKEVIKCLDNRDIKSAVILLNKERGSEPKILKDVLMEMYRYPNATAQQLEEKAKEKAMIEVKELERSMRMLSFCTHSAPLLGLLGTVTGMIKAFQAVAVHGTGDPSVLATGIYEALFTTAFGLIVAIVLLFFYNFISGKIDNIITNMEISITELINNYSYKGQGKMS